MNAREAGYLGIGLGLGAGIALLWAPKSGADSRRMIKSKINEATEMARRQGTQLRDAAVEHVDRAKHTAMEQVDRAKQKIADTREHVSAAVSAGKQAFRAGATGETGLG